MMKNVLMENRNKNGMSTTSVCVISNSGRASLAPTKIPNDVHHASSIQVLHKAIAQTLKPLYMITGRGAPHPVGDD